MTDVDTLVEKGKISAELGAATLAESDFGEAAAAVEQMAPKQLIEADGTVTEPSALPMLMRAAFEELEEKQKTVDWDRMLRKARQKIMDADGEND